MHYVQNILSFLKKNYEKEKVSKKITSEEVNFCKKLIKQIDRFCLNKKTIEEVRYKNFKSSNMKVDAYTSKKKIKDKANFKKFENQVIKTTKYDQIKA